MQSDEEWTTRPLIRKRNWFSFRAAEGVLNIFHEKSADDYEDAGPVKTQPSARTMAFDPKTKKIFLSAAEYIETPATTPGGRPQRSMKPGSFVVLVVSK